MCSSNSVETAKDNVQKPILIHTTCNGDARPGPEISYLTELREIVHNVKVKTWFEGDEKCRVFDSPGGAHRCS